MAVKHIGATRFQFIGLSVDEKPMDVGEGATFLSVNTGERWVFHDGMWIMDLQTAALPQRLLALA